MFQSPWSLLSIRGPVGILSGSNKSKDLESDLGGEMKRLIALGLLVSILSGCGGSKTAGEAAIVAVAAATMQAAQKIQEERRRNRGESYECTNYCTFDEVPCGDDCVPYGSVCYIAPRRACYGGDPNAPEEPQPRRADEPHPELKKDMGVILFSPVY
jgi:hypothetical protein